MQYSDVVTDLVVQTAQTGVGGNLKIAQTLARVGVKLSKESVHRWRNNPRKPTTQLKKQQTTSGPVLTAKRPNHIWMLDITHIRGLFGLFNFQLAVVIDVFSRMPIVGQIFVSNPSGIQMAALVEEAASKYGPLKHFVSDQGSQFTSSEFSQALKDLGVLQRFGAIGKSGSIAIIERLWRTLKEMLRLKLWPPLTTSGLQQRLLSGLHYYSYCRPHQGLGGATPAEIYYSESPVHLAATRPPRFYENKSDDKLFEIAYLDPEHLLPVLVSRAA